MQYGNPRCQSYSRPEEPGHDCLWLLHIPGNGGTSIRRAFNQWGGWHVNYTHHRASKMRQVFPAARARQMFAVIRDPRERALKAWAWAKRAATWVPLYPRQPQATLLPALFGAGEDPNPFFEAVNFPDLVSLCHHFTPQIDYLDAADIALIPFSDLQRGLDALVKKYGGSQITLPEKHESASGRPPVSILSPRSLARLDEFYEADKRLAASVAGAYPAIFSPASSRSSA